MCHLESHCSCEGSNLVILTTTVIKRAETLWLFPKVVTSSDVGEALLCVQRSTVITTHVQVCGSYMYLGETLGILFSRLEATCGRWPYFFSFRGAYYYTTIALIWIDGNSVRSAEKKLIFQAEWLSVPGLGRIEEEAALRSRCGFNFFNSLPKVERFDAAAAGA